MQHLYQLLRNTKLQALPTSRALNGPQMAPQSPPDLLTSSTPIHLTPYTTHRCPEPVYTTTIHPSYTLANPASALYLASLRSLPIRLLSPFSPSILSSYPLISKTTEAYTAPHSLLFSTHDPNTFFAGSANLIAVFDINRNGEASGVEPLEASAA
ncbi:MAG: hypothetical protein Q9204_000486 [Flavoplaca sp. TL-2023a]